MCVYGSRSRGWFVKESWKITAGADVFLRGIATAFALCDREASNRAFNVPKELLSDSFAVIRPFSVGWDSYIMFISNLRV